MARRLRSAPVKSRGGQGAVDERPPTEHEPSHHNLGSCLGGIGLRLLGRLGRIGGEAAHRVSAQAAHRAKHSVHRLPSGGGKKSRCRPAGNGALFGLPYQQRLEEPGDREAQSVRREGTRNSLATGMAPAAARVFFAQSSRQRGQAYLPVLPWSDGNTRSPAVPPAQNFVDGRLHRLPHEIKKGCCPSGESHARRPCVGSATGERL